jgi:hypothetical protein
MQPLDFEEPLDSLDSFSEKLWAKVPELIRKDVEQHVVAHLPDNLLTKLRDLHARGIPISSDDAFFHLAAAWLSGTFAENDSYHVSLIRTRAPIGAIRWT